MAWLEFALGFFAGGRSLFRILSALRLCLLGGQLLLIQADKINWIQKQWRKAPISGRIGNHTPCKGEQLPWAFNKEDLLNWLGKQPLVHHCPDLEFTMVHAGIPPIWSLKKADFYQIAPLEEIYWLVRPCITFPRELNFFWRRLRAVIKNIERKT